MHLSIIYKREVSIHLTGIICELAGLTLLCELLQLLYYSFSSLCNFDPICNIVIYFLLVLNFVTVICVLSINVKLKKKKKKKKKKGSQLKHHVGDAKS